MSEAARRHALRHGRGGICRVMEGAVREDFLRFCHVGGAGADAHCAERRSPSINALSSCTAWAG